MEKHPPVGRETRKIKKRSLPKEVPVAAPTESGANICSVCDRRFSSKDALTDHTQNAHAEGVVSDAENLPQKKKRRWPASPKTFGDGFVCSICRLGFATDDEIKEHVHSSHSEHQTPSSSDPLPLPVKKRSDVNEVKPKRKKIIDKEKLFQCCYCTYQHYDRTAIARHEAYHTGRFKHRCKECGYGAYDKSTMRLHMRRHTKPMDYMCHKCGKAYNTYSGYRAHLKAHLGVGVHECPVCKKDFASLSSKVVHMFEHENKLPYGCHLCSFECKYPCGMRRHLLQKHNFKAKKVFPRYHLLSFRDKFKKKRYCPDLVDQSSYDPVEDVDQPSSSDMEAAMVMNVGGEEVMLGEASLDGDDRPFTYIPH